MTICSTYLLGVLEVLEEGLFVPKRLVFTRLDRYIPSDTLVHVGSGLGEALRLASLTAEDTAHGNGSSAPPTDAAQ